MAGLSLSLGLGLGPMRRTASAAFSPSALFAASEPGFWAEVSPATLWQDTARTTPVTAAGQTVASWLLNTAAGPIYATQATAASRPIYQVDGNGKAYLLFDGTDDFLLTGTITPGTDKAQVFAGVRKLSDAASAVVAELSTAYSSNAGTFALWAPFGAAANYSWVSRGSALPANATSLGYASPTTNVITGLSDISADQMILRADGTQVASNSGDQGTGNFLAYPLYIGRRGGTTLPFNGRLYGLALRFGANLSADQITQMETWMNSKTGAY